MTLKKFLEEKGVQTTEPSIDLGSIYLEHYVLVDESPNLEKLGKICSEFLDIYMKCLVKGLKIRDKTLTIISFSREYNGIVTIVVQKMFRVNPKKEDLIDNFEIYLRRDVS